LQGSFGKKVFPLNIGNAAGIGSGFNSRVPESSGNAGLGASYLLIPRRRLGLSD
jgi:hypothetical protein